MRPRPDAGTLADRVARLADPGSRRQSVVMVVAYAAGVAGVALAFLHGLSRSTEPLAAVGISLLFLSFACLFYLSVTLVSLEAG